MSDNSSYSKLDPYGPPPADRWYRVILVGLDADGSLGIERREYLARTVYDRAAVFRYATAEAKSLPAENSVGILDERGKLVCLMAGKTGRFASRDLRALVNAKLGIVPTVRPARKDGDKPAKRTSRGAPARKRTSRAKS